MHAPIRIFTVLALISLLAIACNANRSKFPNWLFLDNVAQVSTHSVAGASDYPAVANDDSDNSAVVWSFDPDAGSGSSDSEIYWRRYNALGQPTTAPVRLTLNSFGDYSPAISYDAYANLWYVVWMGDEITSSNIYWAAIDDNGAIYAGPLAISSPTYNDYNPKVFGCSSYANVIWQGDTAANDSDIHYSKVGSNGTVTIPDVSVGSNVKPEIGPNGLISSDCTKLYVTNQRIWSYSPYDSDVRFAIVDINSGNTSINVYPGNSSPDSEDHPALGAIWLTDPPKVSLVWHRENSAGTHSIYYASYNNAGAPCAPATPIQTTLATQATPDGGPTNDYPHVVGMPYGSAYYASLIWRHLDSTTDQIYGTVFSDDCSAPSGLTPQLISTNTLPAGEHNLFAAVAAEYAPDGIPVFSVVWRTSSGRTYARFGSVNGMISGSSAELISDANSAGFPLLAPDTTNAKSTAPDIVYKSDPFLSIWNNQLHVVWVGGSAVSQVWYQQTAWKVALPAASYNTP